MTKPETGWTTRLTVHYTDDEGADHEIAPIRSFTPTFATAGEPVPSIERTHVGLVVQPYSLMFSMTVNAIGAATPRLTALALNGTEFSISVQEKIGDDWSVSTTVLTRCVITGVSPTGATVMGVPQATFSGFSQHADAMDSQGVKTAGPALDRLTTTVRESA